MQEEYEIKIYLITNKIKGIYTQYMYTCGKKKQKYIQNTCSTIEYNVNLHVMQPIAQN